MSINRYIGIQLVCEKETPGWRKILEDSLEPYRSEDGRLHVEMPCGEATSYGRGEFPFEDVPCPCGDPNHWLVKIISFYRIAYTGG